MVTMELGSMAEWRTAESQKSSTVGVCPVGEWGAAKSQLKSSAHSDLLMGWAYPSSIVDYCTNCNSRRS